MMLVTIGIVFGDIGTSPLYVMSAFLLEGNLKVENEFLSAEDFFTIQEHHEIQMDAIEISWLFIIESPLNPSYKTYASAN